MDFSPNSLLASLFVSSIGAGLFMYGKKQERIPQLAAGVVLSVYPYIVTSVPWMIVIAIVILAGLTFFVRAGY